MRQTATVTKIQPGGMAQVQVRRLTACGHDCSECSGNCTQVITGETVVMAKNPLGAALGDVVTVETRTSQILSAAAVVYLLPFGLFFLLYFAASAFLAQPDGGTIPIVVGLLGFVLGILAAVWKDRREKRQKSVHFHIIEIKEKCLGT